MEDIILHAAELGDGPVVLFVHGFPDTWRGWRRQMEAVADTGYRALALDMRGYGESSSPADAALHTHFTRLVTWPGCSIASYQQRRDRGP